jgi:pyruvate dehydrogenase E1 component alpha subunit
MARKTQRVEELAEPASPRDAQGTSLPADQMRCVLGIDGSLVGDASAPVSDVEALDALRLMLLSRAVDDRALKLNRTGAIGIYSPVDGQEASVVGSCWALDPKRDWIVPAYREQPALLRHGLGLANLFGSYMGRLAATRIPEGVNLLPRQVSVGAQLPHAAGLAWGMKLQRRDAVVMAYCGEGASSEGDFHEACNLAGVMSAPLVVVIQNNGWAISTPFARQTAAPTLAARARGYGIAGTLVDGNDFFAVFTAAREAVERARSGGGATLIETRTYRMGFHNTTDNPREYRDQAQEEVARAADPIARLQRYLTVRGVFDDAAAAAMQQSIANDIQRALEEVEAMPRPGLDDVFENVYADIPKRVRTEWDSMRKGLDA